MKPLAFACALTCLTLASLSARADTPSASDQPASPSADQKSLEHTLGIGPAYGRFVGIPYYALAAAGAVGIPLREKHTLRPLVVGELSVGQSEHGLAMASGYAGFGIGTLGRVRASLSARLSYAMVMRATRPDAFVNALAGDIGGFGIGAAAQLGVDVVRTPTFAIGPAVKLSGDLYDGGTAAHGVALIEAAF